MEAHVLQGLLIMYKKRTVGSGSTRGSHYYGPGSLEMRFSYTHFSRV